MKSLVIVLSALNLAGCSRAADVLMSTTFSIPITETTVTTNTKPSKLIGRFWAEWIVETNDSPRAAMEGFDSYSPWGRLTGTNFIIGNFTNTYSIAYCDREHLDRSTQAVTKYVSSNLVSFLVWRGQTNRQYLESIPVTNIVHHWHWDKRQVWTD